MESTEQHLLRRAYHQLRAWARRSRVRNASHVALGAAGLAEHGWVATDIFDLDLLDPHAFAHLWSPASRHAFVAEHVWEHLSEANGLLAAHHCFRYLAPGGYLRLAVPDGAHPDATYIDAVRPGGTGAGASDHRVLYTRPMLTALLESVGFRVEPVEWWDDAGHFHPYSWPGTRARISRSSRYDHRNQGGKLVYTSLIVDGVKP
jgi:predicted SAM-dependent methyltransferase